MQKKKNIQFKLFILLLSALSNTKLEEGNIMT